MPGLSYTLWAFFLLPQAVLVRVGSSVSPAAIAILSKWEESIVAVLVNVGKKGLVCGWCQCHVAQDCLPGLPPGLSEQMFPLCQGLSF